MSPSDARIVRTSLRDVLLGDDARAAFAAATLSERALWPTAVALSGQWRMTPVLRDRLTRPGPIQDAARLDDATTTRLREMVVAASAYSALAVARANEAFELLEHDGVEAVAIKGIGLIASLYGHRSLRMVGDLDVLIAEGTYPAARAALERGGYADENLNLERHLSDIEVSSRVHNVARNLTRDGFEIDVHWQFGANPPAGLRSERIIANALPARLAGRTIRVAAPADAMAIAAHHALRGYFGAHETVKDAYDLGAWWRLKAGAWNLEDVLQTASEAEVETALCALWMLVASRDAVHPCATGIAACRARLTARAWREAEALAAFCEEQFECGARAERTVQLFDAVTLTRTIAGRARRVFTGAPPDGLPSLSVARRPLHQRVRGAIARIARVTRELTRVRSHTGYRALARAQARLRQLRTLM
jgi:hypothetical protein